MTDIRLDLKLFSEGEASESEAAQSHSADTIPGESSSPLGTEQTPAPAAENEYMDGTGDGESSPLSSKELFELLDSRNDRLCLLEKLRDMAAAREYERLSSEAADFASKNSKFDLSQELRGKEFTALLSAGFSVEKAWRAVHIDEILSSAVEEAATQAKAAALAELREIRDRPDENGSGGASPASISQDVGSLSGKGIRDILRRVEKGARVKF